MGTTHFNAVEVLNDLTVDGDATIAGSLSVTGGLYRFAVTAHKGSVGSSLTDAEIFEFTMPVAATLESVQVYCTATAATASVDVKEGGTSVLSAAATPSAGAVVTPTISDANIASGAAVTVHVTTDGTGTITDLSVTLVFKATDV